VVEAQPVERIGRESRLRVGTTTKATTSLAPFGVGGPRPEGPRRDRDFRRCSTGLRLVALGTLTPLLWFSATFGTAHARNAGIRRSSKRGTTILANKCNAKLEGEAPPPSRRGRRGRLGFCPVNISAGPGGAQNGAGG